MFELVEELERVRREAEQLDEGMLLYLLDMAIVEARAKAGACNDNLYAPIKRSWAMGLCCWWERPRWGRLRQLCS
jgi:hypothetical protein